LTGNTIWQRKAKIVEIIGYATENGCLKASDHTAWLVERYRNHQQTLSRTKKTAKSYLQAWFDIGAYSARHGLTTVNPAAGIEAYGPLRAPSAADALKAMYVDIEVCLLASMLVPAEDLPMIWLGRLAGLGVGEVFGLRICDIDWVTGLTRIWRIGGNTYYERDYENGGCLLVDADGNEVTMTEAERSKTLARSGIVLLSPIVLALLVWYVETFHGAGRASGRSADTTRLMVTTGEPGSGSHSTANRVKAAFAALGYVHDGCATHFLRGSFATDVLWLRDSQDQPFGLWLQSRLLRHKVKLKDAVGAATPIYWFDQFDRTAPFEQLAAKMDTVPQLKAMVEVANLLDEKVCSHATTLVPPEDYDEVPADLVPLELAIEELEVGMTTLVMCAGTGAIEVVPVRLRGGHSLLTIRQSVIDDLRGARKESIAVADLAADNDMTLSSMVGHLKGCCVEMFYLPPWAGYRVRLAELGPLYAEWARLADLQERSMSHKEAKRKLRVSPPRMAHLIEEGWLTRDPETDARGTIYITRASVESCELHRDEWMSLRHKPAPAAEGSLIPYATAKAEAAERGAGHSAFQQLIAMGTLQLRRCKRDGTSITAASFDAWVEDGAPIPEIPSTHQPLMSGPGAQRGVPTYAEAPYGQRPAGNGLLVPDTDEQEVLGKIRALVDSHTPVARIVKALNDAKHVNRYGRPWTVGVVRIVIRAADIMGGHHCEWPDGCNRPVSPRTGPGLASWYCDLPQHNARLAMKTKSRRARQEQRRRRRAHGQVTVGAAPHDAPSVSARRDGAA